VTPERAAPGDICPSYATDSSNCFSEMPDFSLVTSHNSRLAHLLLTIVRFMIMFLSWAHRGVGRGWTWVHVPSVTVSQFFCHQLVTFLDFSPLMQSVLFGTHIGGLFVFLIYICLRFAPRPPPGGLCSAPGSRWGTSVPQTP